MNLAFWSVQEMILLYIGLSRGWAGLLDQDGTEVASGLGDAPTSGPSAGALASSSGSASAGIGPRVGVARSSAYEEKKAVGCENFQHVCYMIYSNKRLRSLWVVLSRAVDPIKLEHGRTLLQHKTLRGSKEWSIGVSQSSCMNYLAEVVVSMEDLTALKGAGLVATGVEACGMMHSEEDIESIGKGLWAYIISVVGLEARWLMRYCEMPPGKFCGLLDDGLRAETLETLKGWWDLLLLAEPLRFTDEVLAKCLQDQMWSQSTWVRECFLGLSEANFQSCPPDILSDIEGLATSFRSTKLAEDAFNKLRDKSRHCKQRSIGRRKRYEELLRSTLLADSDRKSTMAKSLAAQAQRISKVSAAAFKQLPVEDFSLGDAWLDQYMQSNETSSASDHLAAPLVFQSLRLVKGDWFLLSKTWLSLLAEQGMALMNTETKEFGVVCHISCHGFIWMNFTHSWRRGRGIIYVCFRDKDGEPSINLEYKCITRLEEWRARKLTVLTPGRAKQAGVEGQVGFAIANDPSEQGCTLLRAAASRGFRGVTVPFMQRLIDHLSVRWETRRRPTLEKEVAALLVKHVFPDKSDEEIATIVAQRSLRPSKCMTTVLTAQNAEVLAMEMCADAGDADVMRDARLEVHKKQVAEASLQRVRAQLRPASGVMAGGGAAASSGDQPRSRAQVPPPRSCLGRSCLARRIR